MSQPMDVTIVGAGAAGIGMGFMLKAIGVKRFAIIEQGCVGDSFRRWPKETRFITPSFYSTPFGLPDLNAITPASSPAISCAMEHPTGDRYADYLSMIASKHELPVIDHCSVESIAPADGDGFSLKTSQGLGTSKLVIWATGEFQFPDTTPFPGADLCIHYANVTRWQAFANQSVCVIGGYESGVDAAVNLANQGCPVRLLVRRPTLGDDASQDPSVCLSPYSIERLNLAQRNGRLTIEYRADIVKVEQRSGWHRITARDGRTWLSVLPPILGTGFKKGGGAKQIQELFHWNDQGYPVLTESDESCRSPGLFLVGPQVRQAHAIFCFVYKFRQRFPLVTAAIATKLGLPMPSMDDPSWLMIDEASGCCDGVCDC